MKLSARTRLFGIVADPVDHVTAPELFERLFAEWQYDGVMLPLQVSPDNLDSFVRGLRGLQNLSGLVVTIPHKTKVGSLLDQVSLRAQLIGAVNVIARDADGTLRGDMLDGVGFVEGLGKGGHAVAGRRVFVAGAGGAASAICFALAEAGAAGLTVSNRTREKAEDLVRRIQAAYPACPTRVGDNDPAGHDIVINATSSGLKPGDPPPFDFAPLGTGMLAAEVIMNPRETPFLKQARAQGCMIHYGEMMVSTQLEQLARYMGASDRRAPNVRR